MIGPVKLEPLSQPIRFKTIETNRDSVAHVFPRFRHWGYIYLEFPLVLKGYFLSIHLPLWLFSGFGFTTVNRKAPDFEK